MNFNKLWRKKKCPICSGKVNTHKEYDYNRLYCWLYKCETDNCPYEYREKYLTHNGRLLIKSICLRLNYHRLIFNETDNLSKGKKIEFMYYSPEVTSYFDATHVKYNFNKSPTIDYFINKLNNLILLS